MECLIGQIISVGLSLMGLWLVVTVLSLIERGGGVKRKGRDSKGEGNSPAAYEQNPRLKNTHLRSDFKESVNDN